MWYFVETPLFVKKLFPSYIWNKEAGAKTIYLTFDDGPTPTITNWVLDELAKYQAKATFFCIGKNIEAHQDIVSRILDNEHCIGNHTQNHLNGWKVSAATYLKDIKVAQKHINLTVNDSLSSSHKLFRPPYGKIRNTQAKQLQKLGYQVIMWDVLSADFDTHISKEKCLQNVLQQVQDGSIVVFHDSVKASENLKYVLPQVLTYFTAKGFQIKAL